MSLQKHLCPCFMIILVSLLFSCSNSTINDDDHLRNNGHLESGYDFGAYPSYFALLRGVKSNNISGNKRNGASDFIKFRKLAAPSVKTTVNVLNFGAKGDGSADDTEAFEKAWAQACSSSENVNFVVPEKKNYLLKPIRFLGPCRSEITMQIAGTITASNDLSDYSKDGRHWLLFDGLQNVVVSGGGIINGNGNIWWQNSCKIDKSKPCKNAPTALTFYKCTNLVVKNLKVENAQQIHTSFEMCNNVQVSNIVVNSSENSPNTDGIHVTATRNIQISTCTIATGDDCISIVSGSHKVQVLGITCGPGHGISIGSLGSGNSEEYVSDVLVNGAKLSRTTNGVRIKTWQGGSGSASNIKFQNVEMQDVQNPIIIDQNYCDQDEPCQEQGSAVQVKNVVYQNIKGTSASDVAIDFDCSKSHPCQGIVLQNVNLAAENTGNSKAICKNVNFLSSGTVSPRCAQDL